MSNPNGFNVTYKYNDSGIRTQKTVNRVTTDYYLEAKTDIIQILNSKQLGKAKVQKINKEC